MLRWGWQASDWYSIYMSLQDMRVCCYGLSLSLSLHLSLCLYVTLSHPLLIPVIEMPFFATATYKEDSKLVTEAIKWLGQACTGNGVDLFFFWLSCYVAWL